RRRQPERVAGQTKVFRQMIGQLAGKGMADETGESRGELTRDVRVFLLVTDDRAHGRQASRNGVHAAGNALAEMKWSKDGHGQISVARPPALATGSARRRRRNGLHRTAPVALMPA